MTAPTRNRRFAITLIEVAIYGAILGMAAVFTMAALGRSAVLRGMARTRSEMLVIAQIELDRIRLLPAEELEPGVFEVEEGEWPANTTVEFEVADTSDAVRLIRVTVSRDLAEGVKSVTLETAVSGGPS